MQQSTSHSDDEITNRLQQYFSTGSPLFAYLGLTIGTVSSSGIEARFNSRPELAGASQDASPFGGVITTILDSLFGLAIMMELGSPMPIATINLRTDFVNSTQPERELGFTARCIGIEKGVARAEGTCTDIMTGTVIARSLAAFAVGTKGPAFDESMVEESPGNG